MKSIKQISLLTVLTVITINAFSQTSRQNVQYAAWQHPIITAFETNSPTLQAFTHSVEEDYFIPLALLSKPSNTIYFVTTLGYIIDSINVGKELAKRISLEQVNPFQVYTKIVCLEEIKELAQIGAIVRKYGNASAKYIPRSTYFSYKENFANTSPFEKIAILDEYEKEVWRLFYLMNLKLIDKTNPEYLTKKSEWQQMQSSKLYLHGAKNIDSIEYTNSSKFATLQKATIRRSTGKIYLYNYENIAVDSFSVKKEKVQELVFEKVDPFALYRNQLENELENVEAQIKRLGKIKFNVSLSSSSKEYNINLFVNYYDFIIDKIFYAVKPNRDFILIDAIDICSKRERRKFVNSKWVTLTPSSVLNGEHRQVVRGEKEYFLYDNRGNIIATVSDKKIQHSSDGVHVDYYEPDIVTATDYSPFGSFLPGRTFRNQGQQLRYGYNGKENDNEIKGEGNQLDFGMRIYDPRLARFLSVDPLTSNFPNKSPYDYASNNPIRYIDKEGKFTVDPTIKQNYPLIYQYLACNLENDVIHSSAIIHAYKTLNPKLLDANIRGTFRDESGPVLTATQYPGGNPGGGHYDPATSMVGSKAMIEINTKIFDYVEGILKDKSKTADQKQEALMFLHEELIHEASHHLVIFGGKDKNGNQIILNKNQQDAAAVFGEAGNGVENLIWGIPEVLSPEDKNKKDVIEGVEPSNPKNKVGVISNIVTTARQTPEGAATLPTVPVEATSTQTQEKKLDNK